MSPLQALVTDPREETAVVVTAKLQHHLDVFYSSVREEIDAEFERQDRLQQRQQKIADSIDSLHSHQAELAEQLKCVVANDFSSDGSSVRLVQVGDGKSEGARRVG